MLRAKSANGQSHIGSSQAPTLPFGTQTFAQSTLASLTRAEVRQQPIDAEADTLLPINRNGCPPSHTHPDAAPVDRRSTVDGRVADTVPFHSLHLFIIRNPFMSASRAMHHPCVSRT
ncbi:hypothetical protein LGN07_12890 [Burkholderia cepacia]|uniref:hypothetical protein n=1 Tax=Burkholderia cepacia TaxID=292 RepID=UPI000B174260|nr:hypothetical protein [Burkholderia cepacia]MCA8119614.1 hypothetical protein [Burkholderia cepacia]